MITLYFSVDNSAQSRLFVDYRAISIRVEQIACVEFQAPNKGSRCTMHPSISNSIMERIYHCLSVNNDFESSNSYLLSKRPSSALIVLLPRLPAKERNYELSSGKEYR